MTPRTKRISPTKVRGLEVEVLRVPEAAAAVELVVAEARAAGQVAVLVAVLAAVLAAGQAAGQVVEEQAAEVGPAVAVE